MADERLQGTKLGEIQTLVEECIEDYLKAIAGGKLATTRVRKRMLSVKTLALEIRKDMIEARKKE
jgi:hypothetical protein